MIITKMRFFGLKTQKTTLFNRSYFLHRFVRNLTDSPPLREVSDEVKEILKTRKVPYVENSEHFTLKFCPKCRPHKNLNNNLYKLTVWKLRGGFYCNRCMSKGNFSKFKTLFNEFKPQQSSLKESLESNHNDKVKLKKIISSKKLDSIKNMTETAQKTLYDSEESRELNFIEKQRGLTKETLQKYNVGTLEWKFYTGEVNETIEKSVVYPMYNLVEGEMILSRLKVRSFENKSKQSLYPKGGSWGLFGYHLINENDKKIILTEGEYDAMAVYQGTGMKAISLPNGCHNLPIELLPLFEQFEKIYLWMDNDIMGQESAIKFAHKLGVEKCFLVLTTADSSGNVLKDANEVLLEGQDLTGLINSAEVTPHKQIASFSDISKDIFREIKNPDSTRGVQLMTLPCFNQLLKGHRSGELTIFTGQTGIGKTTLLSQISLDLAQQGVNTLWGSFEIKTSRLGKLMIKQFSGINMENHLEKYDVISQQFETLNMRFLRFFGTTDLDEVMDAMEYANHVYDVKHIVIDNLQFMMGHSQNFNRFEQQDLAISTLRQFATNKNVHITVVIHPRKEQEGKELGISSIFGSAKASQEADNIIVLENFKDKKCIHMKKNRFSGDLGEVEYKFDKEAALFFTEKTHTDMGKPLGILKTHSYLEKRKKMEMNGETNLDHCVDAEEVPYTNTEEKSIPQTVVAKKNESVDIKFD